MRQSFKKLEIFLGKQRGHRSLQSLALQPSLARHSYRTLPKNFFEIARIFKRLLSQLSQLLNQLNVRMYREVKHLGYPCSLYHSRDVLGPYQISMSSKLFSVLAVHQKTPLQKYSSIYFRLRILHNSRHNKGLSDNIIVKNDNRNVFCRLRSWKCDMFQNNYSISITELPLQQVPISESFSWKHSPKGVF